MSDKITPGSWRVWLIAARPKTLTAAVVPVLAGSSLAYCEARMHLWWITICALISTLCIQIGTNYVNDAIDFKKGADTKERLGPIRATQQGLITPQTLLKGALVMFIISVITGIMLVMHGGLSILIIGILSVLFGYGYTSGPYPLAYHGLGEIFVIIFFGVVAVGGIFFLHTGSYSTSAFVLGLQIGLFASLIIEINNFRDIHGDTAVNKRTLAVVMGESGYKTLIEITALLPFLLGIYWVKFFSLLTIAPLCLLPLAVYIVGRIKISSPSKECNSCLGKAALLHGAFGLIIVISQIVYKM